MESTQSAYEQWLARRETHRRLCAAGGEDRLSALPDDVLRLILQRLDTRSALATAALSKRWSRLPREIPVIEFKVGDVLPERYRRYLRRRVDAAVDRRQRDSSFDRLISRYERRSMRSLASAVTSFLDAADYGSGRSAQALTLEVLPTHNSAPFNRLIAKAVGDWGVQDLAIVVLKQPTPCHDDSYRFPHHCFEDDSKSAGSGNLKRLRLSNCAPLASGGQSRTPLAFSSLTVLVLQDMPRTIRGRVYERIIRACPMLEVLHLKSCLTRARISIDTQTSRIKELVIDKCIFISFSVRSLPKLEKLACQGAPLSLRFGPLPILTHLNFSFYDDPNAGPDPQYAAFFGARDEHSALEFSSPCSALENLVVRFSGPEMWLVTDLRAPLGKLRRLLVADMPRSWDMSWTCRLLEAAPFLETLHVHVTNHDSEWGTAFGPTIPEPPSGFMHGALREVVILGFEGTETQLHFVSFLKAACTVLENVVLLKYGCVQERGLWDWDVVTY